MLARDEESECECLPSLVTSSANSRVFSLSPALPYACVNRTTSLRRKTGVGRVHATRLGRLYPAGHRLSDRYLAHLGVLRQPTHKVKCHDCRHGLVLPRLKDVVVHLLGRWGALSLKHDVS